MTAPLAQSKHGIDPRTPSGPVDAPIRLVTPLPVDPGAAVDACQRIAVLSGKGGVGKTNLAVNLALELQRRGRGALLVDADTGLANADVLLGVAARWTIGDWLLGRCAVDEAIHCHQTGLRFLCGAVATDSCGEHTLDRELAERAVDLPSAVDADYLVIDCPAGLASPTIRLASWAHLALVVTTPEPTAMADAYTVIKTLFTEGYAGSIHLLVNMVDSRAEAHATFERIRAVGEKFLELSLASAGYVLHDTHVELAVRQRTPFVLRYPKCSASICCAAIAARLAGSVGAPTEGAGWFGKMVRMFA